VILTILEVTVDGESKGRGMVMDDSIPAGELSLRLIFRIGAENATPERLRELVKWIETHSPVGDSVSRAVPTKVEVEVV
jgi:hypothetical protein